MKGFYEYALEQINKYIYFVEEKIKDGDKDISTTQELEYLRARQKELEDILAEREND